MTIQNLDIRIAEAVTESKSSTEIRALISDTEAAQQAAVADKERVEAVALDPTIHSDELDQARRQLADAEFRISRLQAAVVKLYTRLAVATSEEEEATRLAERLRIEAERDAIAKEIAEFYPSAVERMSDLLARLSANNKDCARIRVRNAERIARGDGACDTGMLSLTACNLVMFEPIVGAWAWVKGKRGSRWIDPLNRRGQP